MPSSTWLLASLTLGGCAYRQNSPPVNVVEAIPPDEAMQKRDWAQSEAMYPNGAVAAGPTDFNYEPRQNMPEQNYWVADSGTFFVNMALLPYNLLKHPPTQVKIYPGETVPTSYTDQPVMPPAGMAQPGTPPVIEQNPGAEPSTPRVLPDGDQARSSSTDAKAQATPEAPAPVQSTPAPMRETTPTPAPAPTPAPEITPAPTPQATPAPAPAPEPAPAPGEAAPRTPRIIEPPPPQATKNLAPPLHRSPATEPMLNK